MPHDPLAAVVRVRRIALDEARRALAECLGAEERAARSLSQGEAEIVLERASASRPDADDAAVEAFAAWLRIARIRSAQDSAALERISAAAVRARAIVAVARGSLEAAEIAQEQKAEDRRRARERRDQLGLEDAARGHPDGARLGGGHDPDPESPHAESPNAGSPSAGSQKRMSGDIAPVDVLNKPVLNRLGHLREGLDPCGSQ